MELNQDDEVVAVYLHGPGIDNPLAMLRDHDGNGVIEADEVFVFTKDHLNSVREITDHSQKLIQRYNYSAYGKTKMERISGGADIRFVENYFSYTSREWEPEVHNLICNINRCHDMNGRWLSEDPIGFRGGDGNLYNAFKNNPLIYTDPLGLREGDIGGGGGGLILAVVGGVALGVLAPKCDKNSQGKEESANKEKKKCLKIKANLEEVCSDPEQKYRTYCMQPPIVCK